MAQQNQQNSPVNDLLHGLQNVWEQVQPYAFPLLGQVQRVLQPLWAALEPHMGDHVHTLNQQLHDHAPLSVIGITVLATFLLTKLMGAAKRVTSLLTVGVVLAYAWPYVVQQLKNLK